MADSLRKKRYSYIDNMKLAACILVVIGHFVMSMTANSLMPRSFVSEYLLDTVYTFHVPMFFICSGFLYQKADRVHSFSAWKTSVLRKFLDLGVPYTVFTAITVLLKKMFESEVTSKANELLDTLVFNPTAPYWYLYVLMFFFIIVPCMKSKKGALVFLGVSLCISIGLAVVYTAGISPEKSLYKLTHSYVLYSVVRMIIYSLKRLLWFALGMYLAFADEGNVKKACRFIAVPALVAAVALSVLSFDYSKGYYNEIQNIGIGILFIVFIVLTAISLTPAWLNRFSLKSSEWFMPVFVLHTIFSAGIRIVLIRLGITNLALHILGGIIGGFILPVITYIICAKLTPLMFFFYPTKTIKILRQKNEQNKTVIRKK